NRRHDTSTFTNVSVHGGAPPRSATVKDVPITYTEALWKTIAVTGTNTWLFTSGWAPKTEAWEEWLKEAQEAALSEPKKVKHDPESKQEIWQIKNWDSRQVLGTILKRRTTEKSPPVTRHNFPFPHHPPLQEV
ncbi:hypothetical protein LTR66_016673, partial [Elasticomyces elasticus]